MKINYLVIILVLGWSWLVRGMSLDRLTSLDSERELARAQICDTNLNSNNLVTVEQILNSLWDFSYAYLLAMHVFGKNELLDKFKANFCKNIIKNSRLSWSDYIPVIANFNSCTQQLKDLLLTGEPNLVWLEYLLKDSYNMLINSSLDVKLQRLITDLNNHKSVLSTVCMPDVSVGALTGSTELSSSAASVTCLPVIAPVAGVRSFEPMKEIIELKSGRFTKLNPVLTVHTFRPRFMGFFDDKSRLMGGLNAVNMKSYPLIGKYFNDSIKYRARLTDNFGAYISDYDVDHYVLAAPYIIIENNYAAMQPSIPAGIKTVLGGKNVLPANVEFYTQLAVWSGDVVPFGAAPANQAGIDRGFNLVFHGALADWYLDLTWSFDTQNIVKNLPMGLFNIDGIILGGDLPIDSLRNLSVNPHNQAYSPPNATFKIASVRNIVSFWSVAVSADGDNPVGGKRAIVTYHVLINQAAYTNLVQNIETACLAENLAILVRQLRDINLNLISPEAENQDRVTWRSSLDFMDSLYAGI